MYLKLTKSRCTSVNSGENIIKNERSVRIIDRQYRGYNLMPPDALDDVTDPSRIRDGCSLAAELGQL